MNHQCRMPHSGTPHFVQHEGDSDLSEPEWFCPGRWAQTSNGVFCSIVVRLTMSQSPNGIRSEVGALHRCEIIPGRAAFSFSELCCDQFEGRWSKGRSIQQGSAILEQDSVCTSGAEGYATTFFDELRVIDAPPLEWRPDRHVGPKKRVTCHVD